METPKRAHFIDGGWCDPVRDDWFVVDDPATGQPAAWAARGTADDVDRAVTAAKRARKGRWGSTSAGDRVDLLHRIAEVIERNADALVEAEVRDTGRPLGMARTFDLPRCAATFREFAEIFAEVRHEPTDFETPHGLVTRGFTHYRELGVVGLICPWNLPLVLLAWKLAPALVMGNTVVIKASEHSPSSAGLLAAMLGEAGVPPGVVNVVHGHAPVGEAIAAHPDIRGLSFTGQTSTGRAIMAAAAPTLKSVSLELGGKNAAVVFADADLSRALPQVARSIFLHAGQLCLCNERIFVERSLYPTVRDALAEIAENLAVGDPRELSTRMGPLCTAAQRDKVVAAWAQAEAEGATVCAGGTPPSLPPPHDGGYFVRPTIWSDLPETSSLWQQEVFGPVAAIAPFDDIDEVIERVNDTDYGLCASVWTTTREKSVRVASRLDVGVMWVNCWLVRDLRTPFGGIKHSGIGREGGVHSLDAFSELVHVTVAEQ